MARRNSKAEALKQGISPQVLAAAAPDLVFDPGIIRRDQGQAVFQQTFLQFSDRMVGGARIPNGQKKMKEHAALFAKVEQKYGVPAPVLTAFWGLESDFGGNFGNFRILKALATLAYDCRRPEFFRQQLFDALRIVQRGDQRMEDMVGDWAGEFGGMQFTASDYLKNAVDFDGDGRRDLIRSIPDTLASAANFLVSLGWRRGEPWLQEVHVPAKPAVAGGRPQHPAPGLAVGAMGRQGRARDVAARRLPASLHPADGPARAGLPRLPELQGLPRLEFGLWSIPPPSPISRRAWRARPMSSHAGAGIVQSLSTAADDGDAASAQRHGYNIGEADGKFGSATRSAVKKAQIKVGLPADSYPTVELIAKLR